LIGVAPTRRYQRGSLREEGRYYVLRFRGEAPTMGQRRPERSVRVGLVSELKTRQAARLEADRRLALLGVADRQHGTRARLADYLASYLAGSIATKRKSSRAAFASYARHLEREVGTLWLDQVSIGVAQAMIAKLLQRGLSPPTIYAITSFLRRLLKSARAEGIAAVVIGPRELSFPRESRAPTVVRGFSIEETRRILAAAEWPWRALYALQAYLGLRAGESLAIAWPAIDFAGKQIRIQQQAAHGELAALKSRNSSAVLPLPDALAQVLRDYREHWIANERQLLFANRRGAPLWAGGVRANHLHPLLKRLGIAKSGFHAWRHSLASEAFRTGAGAAAVQRLLRHGSINVTLKYSHVEFDDLVRSSDAVAQRLAVRSEETQGCGDANAARRAMSEVSVAGVLELRSESTTEGAP